MVPFEYNGVKHWKCTTEGHDEPWCYDERGNESWDTCSNCTEGILTNHHDKTFNESVINNYIYYL